MRQEARARAASRACLLALVLLPAAAFAQSPAAARLTDLEYGQAGGEKLLLDVSIPSGPGPFPVAILVHGGGWSGGDKRGASEPGSGADITPWFTPLTDDKFTWFSINYRLAPRHRWPACLDDVLTAIRWVKAHAAEWKGDPSRIALLGHSAGGHLVTLAATLVDDSVRVQAVVGYAPVTNHEQDLPVRGGLSPSLQGLLNRPRELSPESLGLLRAISPLNHLRPGLPPFLLLHGDADRTVPLQQSLDFQAKLRASGVRCDLVTLPGAAHRLTEWDRFMPDHGARMVAWLREVLGAPATAVSPSTPTRWGARFLEREPGWYASAEARRVADSVLRHQSPEGGWPKSTDLTIPPVSGDSVVATGADLRANTIDNDATTLPMQFLARVAHATGEATYRAAFGRGLDYLLAAQYGNGGWPQYFPLREGYYSHITYNDNAMVNVLTILRDVAAGGPPYTFVDAVRRSRSASAVARGVDCILRTQVRQAGTLTAWCAQHDERTLVPAWARNFEPPTLSGHESVGIVRFLMSLESPTPQVVAAVEAAVAWLRAVAIHGVHLEELTVDGQRDRRVVADPAAEPLWARFYDLGTNRPVFTGRDQVIRHALAEIERERRMGYAYYGTWPATLLSTHYPRWRKSRGLSDSRP